MGEARRRKLAGLTKPKKPKREWKHAARVKRDEFMDDTSFITAMTLVAMMRARRGRGMFLSARDLAETDKG